MKRLIILILLIQLAGCTSKPPPPKAVNAVATFDSSKVTFSDHAQSMLMVYKDGSAWAYKSTDVGYKMQSYSCTAFSKIFKDVKPAPDIQYCIAKFITLTNASQGSETSDKQITVELRPLAAPDHPALVLHQVCDKIALEDEYYCTTKYGCCGADDALAFYDYQNNLLVPGDVRILKASVPNSNTRFYIGYKTTFNDSNYLGTLFMSYGYTDKYEVKIKAGSKLPSKCEYMTPGISLQSKSARDSHYDNEYELWSMEKIKDKNEINDIAIQLVFECTTENKTDTVTIPIVNGKPFGKDDKVIVITADDFSSAGKKHRT